MSNPSEIYSFCKNKDVGSAQTALAIIASHLLKKDHWPPVMAALGMLIPPDETKPDWLEVHEYLAICFYQRFKAVVANFDEDSWELTEDDINQAVQRAIEQRAAGNESLADLTRS